MELLSAKMVTLSLGDSGLPSFSHSLLVMAPFAAWQLMFAVLFPAIRSDVGPVISTPDIRSGKRRGVPFCLGLPERIRF